jgi:uncharacterized protein YqgV (UPF0045/DUF77 family)
MNSRIQELLKEAGVAYAVMPQNTVYEKFADLLIRECAQFIRKYNYECIRQDVPYGVTSEDILNHFQMNKD